MDFIKEITCIQAVGTSDDEARKYGYESWIDYCHKVNIFTRFITKCPCCKKSFTNNNPAVGGHVLAERVLDCYRSLTAWRAHVDDHCISITI